MNRASNERVPAAVNARPGSGVADASTTHGLVRGAQGVFGVPLQDRPYRYAFPAARRRAMRQRRRLIRTLVVAGLLLAAVVWLTTSGGGGGRVSASQHVSVDVTAAHQLTPGAGPSGTGAGAPRSVGTPDVTSGPGALPWPLSGQSAVDIPSIGFSVQSGVEHPVPVASLTKIMTAYVILRDHPLTPGEPSPRITLTAADAADFGTDTVTDQANVELKTGEVLTEYQMLEGLLVHSANDLAYSLACWDAGSVPAFVAKMNAAAASLGMTGTQYADASGFDPTSKSTAADLLKVTAAAMASPEFDLIVDMPSVTLPVAGDVQSYTPLVGTTGVVGVKSGFTDAAGGGDVLAYRASVNGRSFLVLAAVTSQEGPTVLDAAAKEALAIARAAAGRVHAATVTTAGTPVARISSGVRSVEAVTVAAASVLYVTGDTVRQIVHVRAPRVGAPAGTRVGSVDYEVGGERVTVPVRIAARLR